MTEQITYELSEGFRNKRRNMNSIAKHWVQNNMVSLCGGRNGGRVGVYNLFEKIKITRRTTGARGREVVKVSCKLWNIL